MSELGLYNTASKTIEAFIPERVGQVGIYSCGPTVYSRQHIGNLRTYVFTDLLRRALEHFGYEVRHVINVTDVGHLSDDADAGEDKVERAARDGKSRALDLAEHFFSLFTSDLGRLNVREPTLFCRATEHIAEQVALCQRLEARDFTYRLPDGLYFDTARDPHYGALAGLEASRRHSRVAAAGRKRNPADFALWKFSPKQGPSRQLEWPSPWGTGFPGWHLECSAMASKYLGERFDIHTGGIDHVPVHHVNEIAQSENAFGVRPWVRYWMHAAWLLSDGDKISKSAGSAPSLDDLAELGIEPDAFRYYLATAHYRAPLTLDLEALAAARSAWLRLSRFVAGFGGDDAVAPTHPLARELAADFDRALARDLDAPGALAVIWRAHGANAVQARERAQLVARLGAVLGLRWAPEREPLVDPEIDALVAARESARAARDFARADRIRDELAARRVQVDDTPSGPRWRRS
jgi:cysteinyl-tRNA synthetase